MYDNHYVKYGKRNDSWMYVYDWNMIYVVRDS